MNDFDWWFSLLNINLRLKIKYLEQFKTTDRIWYEFLKDDVYRKQYNAEKIENLKEQVKNKGIKIVKYTDDNYPKDIKYIEDAPFLIFYKGNINKLNENRNISIVGSRNCTSYGTTITKIIAKALAENNIPIISGLARGIDSVAHKAAVDNNGFTCGVLGCGIDVIYPRENAKLYGQLEEKGCIISEFYPGTPPNGRNFPIRNRLISALSELVIVVEASEKSGSLITTRFAIEQGKEVMAVPGSLLAEQSNGTNKLILEGAHVFTKVQDIFDNVKLNFNRIKITRWQENLSEAERKLCKIINSSPIHIDDIIKLSNIDITRVYELLFEMQFKNEIMCLSGNYYVRVNHSI